MKVFISWSGPRSKHVATALHAWLPNLLQEIEPWMSAKDIDAGRRWSGDIADNLEAANFGIVCVTPENVTAPWLLFEAGALAKQVAEARVVPYLIGFPNEHVTLSGPLSSFQAKLANEQHTREMVHSLSKSLSKPFEAARVNELFDMWWPKLATPIKDAPPPSDAAPKPTSEQLLIDIAAQVNGLAANLDEVRRWTRPKRFAEFVINGGGQGAGISRALSMRDVGSLAADELEAQEAAKPRFGIGGSVIPGTEPDAADHEKK